MEVRSLDNPRRGAHDPAGVATNAPPRRSSRVRRSTDARQRPWSFRAMELLRPSLSGTDALTVESADRRREPTRAARAWDTWRDLVRRPTRTRHEDAVATWSDRRLVARWSNYAPAGHADRPRGVRGPRGPSWSQSDALAPSVGRLECRRRPRRLAVVHASWGWVLTPAWDHAASAEADEACRVRRDLRAHEIHVTRVALAGRATLPVESAADELHGTAGNVAHEVHGPADYVTDSHVYLLVLERDPPPCRTMAGMGAE